MVAAWLGLVAFVFYRGFSNPDPFDFITTLAAWWGGVISVGVAAAIIRVARVRRADIET